MNYKGMFNNSHASYSDYSSSFAYSKKQASVLSTSMLTASIGFIAIFAIGMLCQYFLTSNNSTALSIDLLYTISSIGILVGMVLSIIWCFRVYQASMGFALATIITYCISYGIGFGFLFVALELREIIFAFGMVGMIFLGTFLVAKGMSLKTALKLGKLVWISSIVAMFSFLIISMITLFTPIFSYGNARTIVLVTSGISGALSVMYLVWSMWSAQNMDNFIQDEQLSKKMGLFIGFQILVNLIQLVMVIIRLLLIFGRRN